MGPLGQRKEPKTGKGIESKSLVMKRGREQYRGPVSIERPCYLGIILVLQMLISSYFT